MSERLGAVFPDVLGDGGGLPSELPLATLRRKATFSWGWDFGPRVPSAGIWRPVELIREARAAITGHHIGWDALSAAAADITVVVDVDTFGAETGLAAQVRLTAPGGGSHTVTVPITGTTSSAPLRIDDPQLWWTHDLGDPALYDVGIDLVDGDGRVLDRRTDRVGFRPTCSSGRSPRTVTATSSGSPATPP
jgi:beta-mannosidase